MKSPASSTIKTIDPVIVMITGSLCLLLVFPLFHFPTSGFVTGLPWKMEFLSSVFGCTLVAALFIWRRQLLIETFEIDGNEYFRATIGCLVCFFIWSAVSTGWSSSPASAAHHTLSWSLFLIAILITAKFKSSLKFSIAAFVITAAIVGITAISDHLTAADFASVEGTIRIRYAKFAEMLVTCLPLVWAAAIVVGKPRKAYLLLIAGSLGWIAVMLSLSRGAFIAGLAAFVFTFSAIFVFSRRHRIAGLQTAGIWLALTVIVQLFFTFGSSTASTAQYISGAADPSQSTAHMRVFTWKVASQMFRDNPVFGVGADNFGLRFNDSRRQYAVEHPGDPDLEIAEDYLVERAHNEPLQVLAELGIVGFVLLASGFGIFAFWAGKTLLTRRNISPILLACLGGMIGFAVSSMFSSFSFRAVQNGLVFAAVFGIAVRYLRKYSPRESSARRISLSPRLLAATSFILTVLMVLASGRMGVSRVYQLIAERSIEPSVRMHLIESSLAWDNENAGAYSQYSAMKANLGEFDDAAASLRACIDNGVASTEAYSSLMELYARAGDNASAESTMAEAVSVYPRSVFARVRYAQIAEQNGDHSVAQRQIEKARDLDLKQANGWIALLRDGDLAAFYEARTSANIAEPKDLLPSGAVLHFINKPPTGASSK